MLHRVQRCLPATGRVVLALAATMGLVAGLARVAAAEYIPLPVKWSQVPPDRYGGDWTSSGNQRVADDFVCGDRAPIAAVRWWGSYLGEMAEPRPTGHVGPFAITFYYSTPGATAPHPLSLPGTAVVGYRQITAQEEVVGREENDEFVYRYDAYLPQAFDQWLYSQNPNNGIQGELWMSVVNQFEPDWGWEAAAVNHPVVDYAAYWHLPQGWQSSQNTDMAFELMVPEPATLALLSLGAAGLAAGRRRRTM